MSDRHRPVDRMAEIILARPSVTARQLAQELGFAQERSVYYWLRKAGYGGLQSFRAAVLTGLYPVAAPGAARGRLRTGRVAEVPLVAGQGPADGAPRGYVVTTQPVSHGAFALTIDSPDYRPVVEPDDVLLIDPDQEPEDGDLVVIQAGSGQPLLCRTYPRSRPRFVHPVTGRPLALSPGYGPVAEAKVLGRVIGLQRRF